MDQKHLTCPRCGYDLRGQIHSWQSSCPLDGVCSECGYAFLWRDICNERYARLPRLFEHARRDHAMSCVRTLTLMHRPRRFWGALMMHHWISAERLLMFIPLGAAGAAVVILLAWTIGVTVLDMSIPGWGWGFLWSTQFVGERSYLMLTAILTGLVGAVVPLTFVLLPTTLRQARVRPMHLFRIAAYSTVFLTWSFGVALASRLVALWLSFSNIRILGRNNSPYLHFLDDWYPAFGLVVAPLLLLPWWAAALKHYLRLPRPWPIAFLLIAISFMLVAIPALVTWTIVTRWSIM